MRDSTAREATTDEENADNTTPLLPSTEHPSLWRRWAKRVASNGLFWLFAQQIVYTFVSLSYKVLQRTVPVFEIFAVRTTICVPLLFAWMKILRMDSIWGPREMWPLFLARSVIGTTQMALLFSSLSFLPLGDGTALFRTNIVFATLFAWLLRWETINLLMLFGSLICVAGGVFISRPPSLFGGHDEWGADRMIGIGLGSGSAVTSALAFLIISRIGKRASPFHINIWLHSATVVLSIPFLIAGFPKPVVWRLTPTEGALLLGISLMTLVGQLMLTWGLQLSNATVGAAIGSSQLVLSYLAGFLILSEPFTLLAGIGISCIGMGIMFVAFGKELSNCQKASGVQKVEEDTNDSEDSN